MICLGEREGRGGKELSRNMNTADNYWSGVALPTEGLFIM